MTNGVLPCHVSAYKSYMPLTFDGGASSLCKSLFTPGDFISRSWNGCILVQKTVATQSVDYSCLFRVMSGNARITLMVRTGGTVYLALRSSSGDVQRICQTTAVPTLGNVMHIGYSWDGSRLALSVYDTTANTLVQVVESSTNITSLPAWTEEDGIYVGNRADLSLPYKGNIYGGTFGYGVALSGASMAREAASGNMAFGTRFIIHPQVMGLRGTGIIREPNHNDITVLNPDKAAFWNSNAPSSVIQEWWRFIPTIADIPQGAVVLDTDGVVKQKRWVYYPVSESTSKVLVVPLIPDIASDWSLKISFLDLDPSAAGSQVFFWKRTATNIRLLQITRTSTDGFNVTVKKASDTLIGTSPTTVNTCVQGAWNTIELYRIGDLVYLRLNSGAAVSVTLNSQWVTDGYSESSFFAWSLAEKPAYLTEFKQCCAGIACDYIPLDESAGLVARNIVNPSRPASYGENSHVAALVPVSML